MVKDKEPNWWLYMIRCEDGALYTGISNHLLKRWQAHCQGKGAKFFRSRCPESVVYLEYPHDRSSASKREYALKQLSRAQKLALIEQYQHPLSENHRVQSPTST